MANAGTGDAAKHVTPGGGDSVWFLGETYTIKLTGDDTAGAVGLFEGTVPPGSGPPPHIHHPNDETFSVLDGEAEFMAAGQTVKATAGSVIHVPRGTLHTYTNTGTGPARYLVLVAPAGFERMFLDFGTPVAEGGTPPPVTPADLERVLAAAPRYGLEVPPPPGS